MTEQQHSTTQKSGGNTIAPDLLITPAAPENTLIQSAVHSATTDKGPILRFRNFCYTIFPIHPMMRTGLEFEVKKMKYLIEGIETCPTTGSKHFQGFVIWKNPRSLSSIIKEYKHLKGHWEICKGNAEQNIEYCAKEDDYIEHGIRPTGRGSRQDIIQISNLVREGRTDREIIDHVGDRWLHCYRGVTRMREIYFENQPRNWVMDVRIYWGPPGTGKTRSVWEEFENGVYPKPIGRWWDGYRGQSCVLIDDFDPDICHEMTYAFYLQLLDRYPLFVDPRFGRVNFCSNVIIFTSNIDPSTWFLEKPNREAFFRRVSTVRYFESSFGGVVELDVPSTRLPAIPNADVSTGVLTAMCGGRTT